MYLKLEDYKKSFYSEIPGDSTLGDFQNNTDAMVQNNQNSNNQDGHSNNQTHLSSTQNIFEMDNFDIGNPLSNFNNNRNQQNQSAFGMPQVIC